MQANRRIKGEGSISPDGIAAPRKERCGMELKKRRRIVGVLVRVLTATTNAALLQQRPDWQEELAKWLIRLGYPSPMDAFFPVEWAKRREAHSEPEEFSLQPLLSRVAHGDLLVSGMSPLTAEVFVPPGQIGAVLLASDGATEEEFLLAAKAAHGLIRQARLQQLAERQRAMLEHARSGFAWTTDAIGAASPHERAFARAVNRHLRGQVQALEKPGVRRSRESAPQRTFRELWLLRDFFTRGGKQTRIADAARAWEQQTVRWLSKDTEGDDAVAKEACLEWRDKSPGTVLPEHMRPSEVRANLERWLGQHLGRNPNVVRDPLALGGWRVLCPRDERRYFVGKIAGGSVCQTDWPGDVDRAFHEMHFGERVRGGQRLRRSAPKRLKGRAREIRADQRSRQKLAAPTE